MRGAWCDIDLEALRANVDALSDRAGVPVLPMVKAEAYGHGLARVAQALADHPRVWGLGVAVVSEASALRAAGYSGRVLLLGALTTGEADEALAAEAIIAVSDPAAAEDLARAAREAGSPVKVHLKVDVGMYRYGVPFGEAPAAAERIAALDGVLLEGVLCHLGAAHHGDPGSAVRTEGELARFHALADRLTARHGPLLRHASNSSVIMAARGPVFDLARPGLAVYGWRPADWLPVAPPLRPVLTVRARVVLVKTTTEEARINYSQTPVAAGRRLGLLPLGYGDGIPQAWGLAGGRVLFPSGPAPLVGSVSMDSCVVDLTGLPDEGNGSTALLLGSGPEGIITPDEMAAATDRIAYEILVGLSPRLPRHYTG